MSVTFLFTIVATLLIVLYGPVHGYAQEPQPPAEEVTPDKWPRTADVGGAKYTIYQPQLDSWDGYQFAATQQFRFFRRVPRSLFSVR